MGTPKGTRCHKISLASDAEAEAGVFVYSNDTDLILQLRRTIPTESDILSPSFKIAVRLSPGEAVQLAGELLTIASAQVKRQIAKEAS